MTHCIVIGKLLSTSKCPVPEANCVWRHRTSGNCMYSDAHANDSPQELAKLVGAKIPTDEEVTLIKAKIKEAVTKEFSN